MSLVIDTQEFIQDYDRGDGIFVEGAVMPESTEIESETSPEESQPTEPTSEVAESQPAESDPGISEDEDFRLRIWNAEMRCRGKEAVVEDLKEQLKDAKSDYEKSVEALRKLASEAHQPMPLFDSKPTESIPPLSLVPAEQAPRTIDEILADQLQSIPIAEWIDSVGIKGFGSSKRDSFSEKFKTLHDFSMRQSDWWSDVAKIGETLASAIEDDFNSFVLRRRELLELWENTEAALESAEYPDDYEFEDPTDYEDADSDDDLNSL